MHALAVTGHDVVGTLCGGLPSLLQFKDGYACGPVAIENARVEPNHTLYNLQTNQSNPTQCGSFPQSVCNIHPPCSFSRLRPQGDKHQQGPIQVPDYW
jgi:hypothetical protein